MLIWPDIQDSKCKSNWEEDEIRTQILSKMKDNEIQREDKAVTVWRIS